MAARLIRLQHRLRWRKCRHCGAPCYSFRLSEKFLLSRGHKPEVARERAGVHWAHVYGEAHCEAPCSRWRRCRCLILCDDCEQPLTKEHVCV